MSKIKVKLIGPTVYGKSKTANVGFIQDYLIFKNDLHAVVQFIFDPLEPIDLVSIRNFEVIP